MSWEAWLHKHLPIQLQHYLQANLKINFTNQRKDQKKNAIMNQAFLMNKRNHDLEIRPLQ